MGGGKFLQAHVGNCPLEDLGKSTKSADFSKSAESRFEEILGGWGDSACRFPGGICMQVSVNMQSGRFEKNLKGGNLHAGFSKSAQWQI